MRLLKAIKPSLSPHEIHSNFSCFLAASGLGTSSWGVLVFGADENPPTQANLSKLPRPKFRDCPPPMERPAMARCSRSVNVGYFFSIKGIRSRSKSCSNVAKASTLSLSKTFPIARSSFIALPLGMTTIIGSIFFSAYKLSKITWGLAPFSHSFSSPPMPCKR